VIISFYVQGEFNIGRHNFKTAMKYCSSMLKEINAFFNCVLKNDIVIKGLWYIIFMSITFYVMCLRS